MILIETFSKVLGYKSIFYIFLMATAAFLDGFGVLLLIPLLEVASANGVSEAQFNTLTALLVNLLNRFGFQLTTTNILLIAILLFSLKGCLVFLIHVYGVLIRKRLLLYYKEKIIKLISTTKTSYFIKNNSGKLLNIFDEQILALLQVFFFATKSMTHLISASVYILIVLLVTPFFGFTTIVFGALVYFSFKTLNRKIRKLSAEFAADGGKLTSHISQIINNHKFLLATNGFKPFFNIASDTLFKFADARFKAGVFAGIAHASREPITMLGLAALVIYQLEVLSEGLAPILISIVLIYRSMNSLIALQSTYQQSVEYSGGQAKVYALINELESNQETHRGTVTVNSSSKIEFDNVSFSFDETEKLHLRDISFTIEPNTFFAIVGPSGAGKTTILDLITGSHLLASGSIRVDGAEIADIDINDWRSRIGYITQEAVIFDGTLEQNLVSHNEFMNDPQKIESMLHDMQLQNYGSEIKDGLKMYLGERGAKMSGGQRQRVHIARELLREPSILLLDEATSALDNQTEQYITEKIDSLYGKTTIIAISHKHSTLKNADQIIVVEDGEIVERGDYNSLLQNPTGYIKKSQKHNQQ